MFDHNYCNKYNMKTILIIDINSYIWDNDHINDEINKLNHDQN